MRVLALALVRVQDWGPELELGLVLVPGQEMPLASHRHRRRPAAGKKLPRSQRPGPDCEEQRQSAQRRKGAWSRVSQVCLLVGWACDSALAGAHTADGIL